MTAEAEDNLIFKEIRAEDESGNEKRYALVGYPEGIGGGTRRLRNYLEQNLGSSDFEVEFETDYGPFEEDSDFSDLSENIDEEVGQATTYISFEIPENFDIEDRMSEVTQNPRVDMAYDGSHVFEWSLGGNDSFKDLESTLRHAGGRHYRENSGLYSDDFDSPEEQDAVIQALGAAKIFEETLNNDDVEDNMDELERLGEYMAFQGLREEFEDYKEKFADGTLPDEAAEVVVEILDDLEEYAEDVEHLATLNNAASQEHSSHMINHAKNFRRVIDRAKKIDMEGYDAPQRLRENLIELGRKQSRLRDIEDDIREGISEIRGDEDEGAE